MKCRLLKGEENPTCTATDSVYMPSSFELEEYCRTDRHRVCPFYRVRRPGDNVKTGHEGAGENPGIKNFYRRPEAFEVTVPGLWLSEIFAVQGSSQSEEGVTS